MEGEFMEGVMTEQKKQEIRALLEACRDTDNSDLEAEKTAYIGELLIEVDRLENLKAGGWRD